MLRLLGLGPKPISPQLKVKLPQINGLVDVAMTGGGPRGQVCVETLTERQFAVSALPGIKPGIVGVFNYTNAVGKFRFSTKCVGLHGSTAAFAIPERVETLQVFTGTQKRAAVRLNATVPVQWRFAPGGKGSGEYVRASLADISRSGVSLVADREVRNGTFIELRFAVSTAAAPLVLLGEVMRSSAVESSKKISLGLRFNGLKPEEAKAITEFINKRQAERRNRGLA